jgi:hypothetical protein
LSRSEEKPSMTHLKDVCSRGGVALDVVLALNVVCSPGEGVPLDVVLALEVVCFPGELGGGVALARHGFDRSGNNNRDNSKKEQNKSKNH